MTDTIDDLIRAFGLRNQGEFVTMLGYKSVNTASNWRRYGISAGGWRRIQKKARGMKIELPPSFYADDKREPIR